MSFYCFLISGYNEYPIFIFIIKRPPLQRHHFNIFFIIETIKKLMEIRT